jgi:2-aminoethylphosphonate-pyruvate transaminase
MLTDWGSREPDFIALTKELRERLLNVVNADDAYAAVPLQGSGTYVVEAALGTLVGPKSKLLVLVNGAYGERIAAITRRLGRSVETLAWPQDTPIDAARASEALAKDKAVTHLAMVHCETTSGILNPLGAVAEAAKGAGVPLIVDAMSSFGALPIDLRATPLMAVLASSNKCLEGAPGLGFAVVAKTALEAAAGISPSISLDLHAQWRGLETDGQWRFTPPVQVVAALVEALRQLEDEGGQTARLKRYRANFAVLADGMGRLGFELYLDPAVQAPIIATFREPKGRGFVFADFYRALSARGFVIYPGKLTKEPSFRIGCIGAVSPEDFGRLVQSIAEILEL